MKFQTIGEVERREMKISMENELNTLKNIYI